MLFCPTPFHASSFLFEAYGTLPRDPSDFSFADIRLTPHYPAKSPLEDVLRLLAPGSDEYVTERYAFEIGSQLNHWSQALVASAHDLSALARSLDSSVEASRLAPAKETTLRSGDGIHSVRRQFAADVVAGREKFLQEIQGWLGQVSRVETAEFEIVAIEEVASAPLRVRADIRYDIVASRNDRREERVGSWHTEWSYDGSRNAHEVWKAHRWEAREEVLSVTDGPVFVDVTSQALGGTKSYTDQMLRGSDYWRTVLDSACGIDVYGNNGVAAGDFDNDGFDDLYVCQPAGLPNRLYRNRGDGTFEDVTEKSGVGVLDNTACASSTGIPPRRRRRCRGGRSRPARDHVACRGVAPAGGHRRRPPLTRRPGYSGCGASGSTGPSSPAGSRLAGTPVRIASLNSVSRIVVLQKPARPASAHARWVARATSAARAAGAPATGPRGRGST